MQTTHAHPQQRLSALTSRSLLIANILPQRQPAPKNSFRERLQTVHRVQASVLKFSISFFLKSCY
jgi:hypothetical protein